MRRHQGLSSAGGQAHKQIITVVWCSSGPLWMEFMGMDASYGHGAKISCISFSSAVFQSELPPFNHTVLKTCFWMTASCLKRNLLQKTGLVPPGESQRTDFQKCFHQWSHFWIYIYIERERARYISLYVYFLKETKEDSIYFIVYVLAFRLQIGLTALQCSLAWEIVACGD